MNLTMFVCSILMCIVTIILMSIRISTHEALDPHGRTVDLSEDPLVFWLLTIFNFAFLISISLAMMVLAIFFS